MSFIVLVNPYKPNLKTEMKNNPTGIRFNKERSEKIMKEHGFTTKQQLVNFLFDFYEGKNIYIARFDKFRDKANKKEQAAVLKKEVPQEPKIKEARPERREGESLVDFMTRFEKWKETNSTLE